MSQPPKIWNVVNLVKGLARSRLCQLAKLDSSSRSSSSSRRRRRRRGRGRRRRRRRRVGA
jgi:hypothetical protein